MKIWHFTKLIRVVTVTSALLLVACSSVANPAPITPMATVISTTLPTATTTLTFSPISSVTVAPATATAIPLTPTYEESVHLFDYDRTVPLDVQKISVEDHEGVAVHDITYAAHDPQYGFPVKGRMSAYLVIPSGTGPFAGVVFMHWLGQPNGNRSEFLEEAVTLAHKGVVSLLVEGVFPWHESPSSYEADQVQVISQVIELRRALDVLLSQPEIDPQRIGYVGHDYGAMFGAILAGVDNRIKTYVLMAGMGNFSDWSLKYWPATGSKGVDAYREAMATVDPIGYIKHATPATLLFQFAQHDRYISEVAALQFYEAGSSPKQVQWYNTSHSLNTDDDRRDRSAWLTSQLGLKDTR
jgi:dienelactone hydrolase